MAGRVYTSRTQVVRGDFAVCSFTKPVDAVARTRIFARGTAGASQLLAYQMDYKSTEALAMVLPLPTPVAPAEDAVRFIDLSGYEEFFNHAERGFEWPVEDPFPTLSGGRRGLRVQEVGSYQASFVPRIADFERLDERFRMPREVWEQLPQYADWSFAVFKLRAGAVKVHPMAFEFPRRDGRRLYFPTLHVHHGAVSQFAFFDHRLYCQRAGAPDGWRTSYVVPPEWHAWQKNDDATHPNTPYEERVQQFWRMVGTWPRPAKEFMAPGLSQGLIEAEHPIYRLEIEHVQRNQDHYC